MEDFGLIFTEENWQGMLKSEHNKSDLHKYIAKTILSTSMEKREKLIMLLAHIEPLIYETLEISKIKNMRLKPAVKKVSVEDIDVAYELFLGLIEILITVEEQLQEQYCVDEM